MPEQPIADDAAAIAARLKEIEEEKRRERQAQEENKDAA